MPWKLPIKTYRKPTITQVFGETKNNEWYKSVGIDIPSHNGVDFGIGTPVQTYGTPLVCPFPVASVVKVTFTTPMETKGNGVTIQYKDEKKIRWQLVLWHTGEVAIKMFDTLKEGDEICFIGNSGICRPAPTPERPYDGSHLHLMLYKNGVLVNPMDYFDENNWYVVSTDSGWEHDLEPLKWSWGVRGVTDWFIKFLEALRWWR